MAMLNNQTVNDLKPFLSRSFKTTIKYRLVGDRKWRIPKDFNAKLI